MYEKPPSGDKEIELSEAERKIFAARMQSDAEAVLGGANPTQGGGIVFTPGQIEKAGAEMEADLAARRAPKSEALAGDRKEGVAFEKIEGIEAVMKAIESLGVQVRIPNPSEKAVYSFNNRRNLLYFFKLPPGGRWKVYDVQGKLKEEGLMNSGETTIDDGTQEFVLEEVSPGSGLFRITGHNKSGTTDVIDFAVRMPEVGGGLKVGSQEGEKVFTIGALNSTEAIRQLKEIAGQSIASLEERMRPGKDSDGGFLGRNESLIDVLASDNDYVLSQGLTHQDLAEPLLHLNKMGQDGEIEYQGQKFRVKIVRYRETGQGSSPFSSAVEKPKPAYRGKQDSPLNDGTFTSTQLTVTNPENGASISYSGLLADMISRYGFYEGHQTRYRLEPARIIEVFSYLKKRGQDKLAKQRQEKG